MKAASKRAVTLLLTAGFVVSALIVFITLMSPAYGEVQQLRGELESKSNFYQSQSQDLEEVQNLIAQYQGVQRLQETLSLVFPSKEEAGDIINQLNVLAQTAGLAISSAGLEYLPVKKEQKIALVKALAPLRLSVRLFGRYASFKVFLESLETNIRVMDLVDLKIKPAGKPGEDNFSYSLTVDTYYQP